MDIKVQRRRRGSFIKGFHSALLKISDGFCHPTAGFGKHKLGLSATYGDKKVWIWTWDHDSGVRHVLKSNKADLILIDTSCLYNTPLNNPASAIVYSSQGSNVDTVICNGDILMEKRELLKSRIDS